MAERLAVMDGDLATVCRSGGEEFVVLAWVPGEPQARAIGERVHRAVGAVRDPVPVTGSVGVTVAVPDDGDPVAWGWSLIGRADEAMYRAKRSGRDRVVVHGGGPAAAVPAPRTERPPPGRRRPWTSSRTGARRRGTRPVRRSRVRTRRPGSRC